MDDPVREPPAGLPASSVQPGDLAFPGFRVPLAACDIDSWGLSTPCSSGLGYLHPLPGEIASRPLDEGFTSLPEVGRSFLGFQLVGELGRGTFGRVYLGRQGDLANRLVALKVSTETAPEAQKLAQLQHTHIVPVYSLHQAGPLSAVCMPYYGGTTLADVLNDLGRRDTMPASGKGLVSTLEDRKSRSRISREEGGKKEEQRGSLDLPVSVRSSSISEAGLRHLEGLTYVEAVLWIGACLADGLAHAHDRGIIHRDLKPANVLLTDDGQPMLLDFNLAQDTKEVRSRGEQVGGTLPYMAPEHLAAFASLDSPVGSPGQKPVVDGRSDLYALGVILYELVTGRHPFVRHPGALETIIPQMIAERLRRPPRVQTYNLAVSPAVESIIRHCLEPDPARRYQSAHDLREDLERQLDHQVLRHAPEPSLLERYRKWTHWHPRLVSTTTLSVVAAVLVGGLVVALFLRSARLARLEALSALGEFRSEALSARLLLASRDEDVGERNEGKEVARRALARYSILDRPDWRNQPLVRHLPDNLREELPGEIRDLALLLASVSGKSDKADLVDRLRGDDGADPKPRHATEIYLEAVERYHQGKHAQAIGLLEKAVRADPENFAAWFLLGNCCLDVSPGDDHPRGPSRTSIGLEAEAIGHYTACLTLRSTYHAAWYNRGIAYLRLGRYRQAEADFTRAIELRPSRVQALVYRALAREGAKQHREALADLDQALQLGAPPTRILLARARIKDARGDRPGAAKDRAEALRRTPLDVEGWIARGVEKVKTDTKGALADFAEAVKREPRSLAGWQNQAHVYSERLGDLRKAISVLDRVLRLYPDHVLAQSSRGVLLARLGRYPEALRDAEKALAKAGHSPVVQFQVAGIYALGSTGNREHRDRAIGLLAQALAGGFGHDLIEKDDDLKKLHADARYRLLVRAASAIRNEAKNK